MFQDLVHCQSAFDRWRTIYNTERPHQAIDMAVPASRYQVSPRAFPETLPELEYSPDDIVRMVQHSGRLHFKGRRFNLPDAFVGQPVGLRPTDHDCLWNVSERVLPICPAHIASRGR